MNYKKYWGCIFGIIIPFFAFSQENSTDQNKDTTKLLEASLTIVENMPKFKGGELAMATFIQKNLEYPAKEKEEGISGTCYVTFVVEKDGTLSNINVLRGITDCEACNKEALRVVGIMPNWTAGTQKGKNVRCAYNLAIKFT